MGLTGETCNLHLPILPEEITIETPPCPITPDSLTTFFDSPLPDSSPLDGITTKMSGDVEIRRGDNGQVLISATVNIIIK